MGLRTRLILSHTLIVAMCLGIVAVAVLLLLQGYRNQFAVARLDDMTIPIYIQARSLAQGQASLDEVWTNLSEQAEGTGVYIFLIDDEGNIIRQASHGENMDKRRIKLPAGGLPADMSEPYHGTYVAPKGQTFIFAIYPLASLFGSQSPSVPEALVLAVPREEALTLWLRFAQPFLWAGLIALGISTVIAILLARSVYRPIQRVTHAAEEITQGRYEHEIQVAGPREVKGLALSFNQMAKQVRLSQQKLRDFVADVSHELGSPLTSIRGFAQAMLDGTIKGEEAQSRATHIIKDESERMIRLTDELLELSRIESGQIRMLHEPVDMGELLQHCQEIFSIQAQEKGLQLGMSLEPVLPVIGDIDRLEQVFSNLIDNAQKHTPAGGKIIIAARQSQTNFVEITIADTGPGIPPEQLPHVFERFYQVKEAKLGIGLGLAIAKEIVRAHGGDIIVSSILGEGTEFLVRLPSSAIAISE